jgi:aspartate kinase
LFYNLEKTAGQAVEQEETMLIVKKFGGTSVADKERIFNVAKRCIEDYEKGNDVVVVLSAMGKYTDELIEKAHDINPNPPKREMDMLFTIGEQMSVSLMAMAMAQLGVRAVSLNAFQVPMHTTSSYGNARLKKIDTERIKRELEDRKIVIITGFQGVNKYDDYTTLGRGGSDTTAVALAAVLHADACEIYTDVDGVYTADPRLVSTAKKLKAITYDEMLDLATLGAGVLHNRSVEMAKKYGVRLVVRSSLNNSEGTVVKEVVNKVERMIISGVALDKNADRISVIGIQDMPGSAFKLFNTLAKKNINVDIIIQSVGRDGTKDISFTVSHENLDEAIALLEEKKEALGFEKVEYNCDVAKLSIVGAGMMSNPGVAAKMFECLYNQDVNINMIATSEIRITVLVAQKDAVAAMNAVHEAFGLSERS